MTNGIELRWLSKDLTADDMTSKEWGEWCRYNMDPDPGPIRTRVLQYRVSGGLWRDVPEER